MAAILKNTTGTLKTWGGIDVDAMSSYSLQLVDTERILSDFDFRADLISGYAVINDGFNDLQAVDAVFFLFSYTPNVIIGGTDSTPIGNAGDRLKIDAFISSDVMLKVSSNDQTSGYLEQKIVGKANQTLVQTLNDGGDEDLEISLANFGTAGTYGSSSKVPVFTTDTKGRIQSVTETDIDHDALMNFVANEHIDHSSVNINAGTGLSGGGDITASRTLSIANTGVAAGTYGSTSQVPQIVLNAQGQATSAINIAISILANQISDFSSAVDARITLQKGQPNGLAPLNGSGVIDSIYLPSFVDDVVEYANLAAFPVTGETGKIYVALDTNKTYRWSGSAYIEISPSEVNSVFGRTGNVTAQNGDYTASQITNVPAGNISSLTLQAAIDELDAEKQPLDADLTAIAGLGTTGLIVRTANGSATTRSIAVSGGLLTISNADGISGNPTIGLLESAINHNNLSNLTTGDPHTQYFFLNGRSGGQTAYGGISAAQDLILSSTSNVNKGKIYLGLGNVLDETNNWFGINTTAPRGALHVVGTSTAQIRGVINFHYSSDTVSSKATFGKARGTPASPTAVLTNDVLANYTFFGYGTNDFIQGAAIRALAQQTFTNSAAGTNIEIQTAALNGTTMNTVATATHDQQFVVAKNLRLGDNTASSTNGDLRYDSTNTEFLGRENGVWRNLTTNPTTVSATANTSTTSATYSTINTMTQTPAAGTYQIEFQCSALLDNDTTADIRITVGGTEQTAYTRTLYIEAAGLLGAVAAYEVPVFIKIPSITVNGSQAINVEFRENGGGTLTVGPRSLTTTPIAR